MSFTHATIVAILEQGGIRLGIHITNAKNGRKWQNLMPSTVKKRNNCQILGADVIFTQFGTLNQMNKLKAIFLAQRLKSTLVTVGLEARKVGPFVPSTDAWHLLETHPIQGCQEALALPMIPNQMFNTDVAHSVDVTQNDVPLGQCCDLVGPGTFGHPNGRGRASPKLCMIGSGPQLHQRVGPQGPRAAHAWDDVCGMSNVKETNCAWKRPECWPPCAWV